MGLFSRFTKSFSEKEIDKMKPQVERTMALEAEYGKLTEGELRAKTDQFKDRFAQGESLDDLLPEAFATVREAAWRVLNMKPYRVQVIGGIVLHQGRIAEMKTGEGKTLVATMPAYLNAIPGKGVHVVTVNDYLASRDAEWMGKIHEYLGLSVGCILQELDNRERQLAYGADITYGTNNQFGFDYLRDNMAVYQADLVQRGLHYAIVDEVDSILIDEARTPLIISGQGDPSTDMYQRANAFIQTLTGRIMKPDEDEVNKLDALLEEHELETVDYVVDEKRKTSNLTEQGNRKAEAYFHVDNIADPNHMELMHYINQALKARTNMKRDIDYVVADGEVKIVDEFTGRIMPGRRYSDGLHQAIEAKEGVEIKSESKTLATITFQNYFRMYDKLAGMTGTAMTEADEFSEIYNLDVIEIPTNKPVIRKDYDDVVYSNAQGKYQAIVDEIVRVHAKGQPILVGTIDIETSELISNILKKEGITHSVLNAKQHAKEAEIVAQAGRLGTVTIATNMAGRGTDIVLGGNPEWMAKKKMANEGYSEEMIEWADSFRQVQPEDSFPSHDQELDESGALQAPSYISGADILEARAKFQQYKEDFSQETRENAEKVREAGGLYILGTSRHEARRIDNQLRGRSGRQGDPGESRFFLAMDDKLLYLHGGDRFRQLGESNIYPDGVPIESKMLTRAVEYAQKKMESNNFAIRKRVLAYDDVMNVQRATIYEERNRVLKGENMRAYLMEMTAGLIQEAVDSFCNEDVTPEGWEMDSLLNYLSDLFLPPSLLTASELKALGREGMAKKLKDTALDLYAHKEEEIGLDNMRELERIVLLRVVDTKWMDHIDAMDQLRKGIGIRAMGQEDPVRAYNNEGYEMFEAMNHAIQEDTVRLIYHVVPVTQAEQMERKQVAQPTAASGGSMDSEEPQKKTYVRKKQKVGRNDPCPCGSGKKYKNCCGRNQ